METDGEEVLGFIEQRVLHGKGIGYVDVHLLASVALTEGAKLWTRYRRLRLVAEALGCAFQDTTAHEASFVVVCRGSCARVPGRLGSQFGVAALR